MKWLWMLLALVLGAIAGTTWLADSGYVLIRLNSWLVETSAVAVFIADNGNRLRRCVAISAASFAQHGKTGRMATQ